MKIAYLSSKDFEALINEMNLLPGHRSKFIELITVINGIMPTLSENGHTTGISPSSSTTNSRNSKKRISLKK